MCRSVWVRHAGPPSDEDIYYHALTRTPGLTFVPARLIDCDLRARFC